MLEDANEEKLHGDEGLTEEQIAALVGGVNVVAVAVVKVVVAGSASSHI